MTWLKENWIGLLALGVAVAALFYTYQQSTLSSRQAQQHIEPVIKTYFDLPKKKNPIFVIANEGYIPVVSASVGNRVFIFDKNINKIASAAEASRIFSPGAIYRDILKPAEHEDLELLKVGPKERLIVVYEFNIKYFREKDMKEFERTEYYFIDGAKITPHGDFIKSQFYRSLMAQIVSFRMPEQERIPGTLRDYLEASAGKKEDNGQP